jgi:hypothetical protein
MARGLGLPRWGNLRRTKPFSEEWGFDRGSPVDRHYLDRFLEGHRAAIRGRVLEIHEPRYTKLYGHDVVEAHTVDINPEHHPTFLCDLARSETVIPSDHYDCFLLPNTLPFLRDVEESLRQALRIVRPGGLILASASPFVPLAGDARDGEDLWHMSGAGWREVARKAWPGASPGSRATGTASPPSPPCSASPTRSSRPRSST